MPTVLEDISPGALALSDDSKMLLAEQLLESIADASTPDAELLEEVARRRAEARANHSLLLPGEEVLREVREAVASHATQQ